MNPITLYNKETGKPSRFRSYKEAARSLGVDYQMFRLAVLQDKDILGYTTIRRRCRCDYVCDENSEQWQELDVPHTAMIDGVRFVAVKRKDKTKCTECDIYKLDPPKTAFHYPLCYEQKCGAKLIVDICSKFKCIWKRKR